MSKVLSHLRLAKDDFAHIAMLFFISWYSGLLS